QWRVFNGCCDVAFDTINKAPERQDQNNWYDGEHSFHWHVIGKLTRIPFIAFTTTVRHDDPQQQDPCDDTNDQCSNPSSNPEVGEQLIVVGCLVGSGIPASFGLLRTCR